MKSLSQTAAAIALLGMALTATVIAQDSTTTSVRVANSFTNQDPPLTFSSSTSLPTNALPTNMSATSTAPLTALTGTELAIFTAGGAVYTATAMSSMVQIAGYNLGNGGQALVGGQQVQVTDAALVVAGTTFPFAPVVASSTEEIVQTSTSSGETTLVYTSSTAPVAGATTASMSASEMSASAASASASASATASSSAGVVPVATAKPQSAVAALGGIAGMLWLLG